MTTRRLGVSAALVEAPAAARRRRGLDGDVVAGSGCLRRPAPGSPHPATSTSRSTASPAST